MQSLSLAVEMVHRRLASIIEDGEQLLDSEGSEFPLQAYFAGKHYLPLVPWKKPHSSGAEIVDAPGDLDFARALQIAQNRA